MKQEKTKPKDILRVNINMDGNRGRKLDMIASMLKTNRCDAVGVIIDEAFDRALQITGEEQ